MDLVNSAGVDVSDWGSFEGGPARAASNPKYCYEWAFIEPHKLIVLNLWHAALETEGERIFQSLNYRKWAGELEAKGQHATWARRARSLDRACQTAWREKLPVRVIICDGNMRGEGSDEASEVNARELDPTPWAVTSYDWDTGACQVTRGAVPSQFADQFSDKPLTEQSVQQRIITGTAFVRSPAVRMAALQRSLGKCEYCNAPGFSTPDGRTYLETHHIQPLSEGGADAITNVIALCPNHHREAHFGNQGENMRIEMQEIVQRRNAQ